MNITPQPWAHVAGGGGLPFFPLGTKPLGPISLLDIYTAVDDYIPPPLDEVEDTDYL